MVTLHRFGDSRAPMVMMGNKRFIIPGILVGK
jgi:hypothetical protein